MAGWRRFTVRGRCLSGKGPQNVRAALLEFRGDEARINLRELELRDRLGSLSDPEQLLESSDRIGAPCVEDLCLELVVESGDFGNSDENE